MKQTYTPPAEILEEYATLIVQFGLQRPDGSALPRGSVVEFKVPEVAKPLYFHLQNAILKAGHYPLGRFLPSSEGEYEFEAAFYRHAKDDQLKHVAVKYQKALIDSIDASIYIIAETNIHELEETCSKKVMLRNNAQKEIIQLKFKKINAGKLSWTIALYGTDQMAKEVGMSSRAYWNQIVKACYLDGPNPVKQWREITKITSQTAQKLTDLQIQLLHWEGTDMDITVGVGVDRVWRAGGGNNIPSYEVFTSPDMRTATGWIRFNQPHFRYGKRIEGIELWFDKGRVVKSQATKNHDLLKSMLETEGGDRLGEISLTDSRISRIEKPMGEILYDENMGGKYGNTHMAIGSSYRDCYKLKPDTVPEKKWVKLGFNDSVIHSDFVSTTDRTVTATLPDDTKKVIYKNGQFTI